MILLQVHCGDEAGGVPNCREFERTCGRDASVGTVDAALEVLESKGLIAFAAVDPIPEPGGKAERSFRVSREGLCQVHANRRVFTSVCQGLPESDRGTK